MMHVECSKRKAFTKGFSPWVIHPFLSVLFLIAAGFAGPAAADYEKPPVLQAGSLFKPEILKGPYHTVDQKVVNDGLFNHYTVKSQFGEFKAITTPGLRMLVHELGAIGEMVKVETDDTVAESLKESAESSVEGLKSLFKDPKGTLEGAGTGLNNLFNTAKGTVGKREPTDAEDSRVEQLIGLTKSKGEIASKYGVNIYSRNQRLQEELNRLARADYLGGLGLGVAKSVVPGPGGLLLTTSDAARLLNDTINTTPASELWLQNKNKLLKMGFDPDTVELFLNHPDFSPDRQTVLVAALEKMDGAENRELFLKVALQATEKEMAWAITRITAMAAGYHQNVSALKRFIPFARIACAVTKDNSVIVLLPTDHIVWSQKIATTAGTLSDGNKNVPQGGKLEIWSLGTYSKRARTELEGMGWAVHGEVSQKLKPKK